jgi:hypothetical protein
MLHLKGTGDLALRWEVARVWRLGRQTTYVIVSAQYTLSPARQQRIDILIGGKQNHPGICVPRASIEFSIT